MLANTGKGLALIWGQGFSKNVYIANLYGGCNLIGAGAGFFKVKGNGIWHNGRFTYFNGLRIAVYQFISLRGTGQISRNRLAAQGFHGTAFRVEGVLIFFVNIVNG